jgi:hypothetical protein
MRRWWYIATFCLLLLSLPVWAQRGSGGAHGSAHAGFSGHSSVGFSGHSSGSIHTSGFSRSSGVRIRTGNSYGRGAYGRRGYYPYFYYPYLGYYGWDADSYDDNNNRDAYADSSPPPPPYRDDSGVERDVQALSGKIDRLQADVEARNRPKPESEPETALVFRDKHVEEVRNYAISGGTLWVLNAQAAKKIPLSQLDLDATVKMNDDRGIDFQVPGPELQLMIVR